MPHPFPVACTCTCSSPKRNLPAPCPTTTTTTTTTTHTHTHTQTHTHTHTHTDCKSHEDIHIVKQGAHLGWPYCEGACDEWSSCSCSKYDDPIWTYAHDCGKAALIGGPVLRNSHWGDKYEGAYFFGDFVHGWIKYAEFEADGSDKVKAVHDFHSGVHSMVGMSQSPRGDLWVYKHESSHYKTGFALYKIAYTANMPPVIVSASASAGTVKNAGNAPMAVMFIGAAKDYDDTGLVYEWVFGDGGKATGQLVSHVYTANGEFKATLHVSDRKTTVTSHPITIMVGIYPEVTIAPPSDLYFSAGEEITLTGTATYQASKGGAKQPLAPAALAWAVGFVHDEHVHPLGLAVRGGSIVFSAPKRGHAYSDGTGLTFSLRGTSPASANTVK